MQVVFLGTGAALSNGERLNTSLVFSSGSDVLLVDCSGTPAWSLARAGVELASVRQVFLTHEHVDHIYALPSLIHSIWLSGYPTEGRRLRIFAHSSVLTICRSIIGAFDLEAKPAALQIDYVEIDGSSKDLDIYLNGWKAEAFSVPHTGLDALGLTLTKGNRRVVFSGDSEKSPEMSRLLGPGTILIHDCGSGIKQGSSHASAQDIAAVVTGTGTDAVFLSHVPALSLEEASQAVEIVRSAGVRKVVIPNDGDAVLI